VEHKTFFNEVGRLLRCDAVRAEAVTAVVFQELGDQLSVKERDDVSAQLSRGLKPLWNERPDEHIPIRRIHHDEFIGRVRSRAALGDEREAERAIYVVFHTLQRALGSPDGTHGEAWDIFAVLPKDVKALWLDAREIVRSQIESGGAS